MSTRSRKPILLVAALVAAAGLLWFLDRRPGEHPRAAARAPAPLELPAFDPSARPARLALLVGIDRYSEDSGLVDLDGSVNDVRAVEELLVGRFDFAADDVVVLENEQATHANLVLAFRGWLLERAGPETEVVFWFSGHGSRVPDADGDEPDGMDETLLAWDSRAGGRSGSYDVVDDELTALLVALGERTARATVVTDCCHSGSVLRGAAGAAPKTRFASAGDEPFDPAGLEAFWPSDLPLDSDETIDRRAYVHVAACAPGQLANEVRDSGAGGGAHGALTLELLNALEDARPEMTYRQLVDEAAVRVASSFPGQTVWYEGTLDRNVLSGRFTPRARGFPARLRSDGRLEVRAGPWRGLRSGSQLVVRDALSGDELGSAVVERAGVTVAEAIFTPLEGASVAGALRAEEVGRPAGLEPLPVYVEDGELSEALRSEESCRVLEAAEPGCYRVTVEEGRFALRTPEGLRVWLESGSQMEGERLERARAGLAARFSDELGYLALQLFTQVPADIPLEASFRPATEEDRTRNGDQLPWNDAGLRQLEGASGGGWIGVGAPSVEDRHVVVLEVKNPGSAPIHVAVFSVAEDRSRHLIWPGLGAGPDQSLVEAGGVRAVPVALLVSDRWELERPMRDRYLVIASTREIEPDTFREQGSQLRSGSSGVWSGVGRLAFPERTRGTGAVVELDPSQLGIAVVDLLVEPARP